MFATAALQTRSITGTTGARISGSTDAGGFREYNFPFWLAVTELEHGEWLVRHDRAADAEPLFAEAQAIFERLEASLWLERAAQVDLEPADVSS